jgi:hypothetical protein
VTEESALKAIESTYATLDDWQRRGEAGYSPRKGSALADDDRDWPYMPVSQIAWMGLWTTTDHLRAIRPHIQAKTLFPMAHLTLCRSALIGAAQAVWVLAPDDGQKRTERARTVAAYLYAEQLKCLRLLRRSGDGSDENAAIHLNLVTERSAQLDAKRAADEQNAKLDYTGMIEQATAAAFGDPRYTNEAVLAWREGSGAAHGLSWPFFGTVAMRQSGSADDDGMATFGVGGTLSVISNPYCAAFQIASKGRELIERRGS